VPEWANASENTLREERASGAKGKKGGGGEDLPIVDVCPLWVVSELLCDHCYVRHPRPRCREVFEHVRLREAVVLLSPAWHHGKDTTDVGFREKGGASSIFLREGDGNTAENLFRSRKGSIGEEGKRAREHDRRCASDQSSPGRPGQPQHFFSLGGRCVSQRIKRNPLKKQNEMRRREWDKKRQGGASATSPECAGEIDARLNCAN
jgi:hypothetical protein